MGYILLPRINLSGNRRTSQITKTVHTGEEGAGITQVGLAERLGRPQSFVSKYERGERRLDVIELCEVCHALGIDPVAFLQRFLQ